MKIRLFVSEDIEAGVEIFRSNIPKYFSEEEESGLRNFLVR